MNKNKHVGLHGKDDFPEHLEGSKGDYSVDVQALFDDGRKCKVFYDFNANCWYYEMPNDVMTPVKGVFRWTYLLEDTKYPFMDVRQQTDKMREYLIGQIKTALYCVEKSTITVLTKQSIPLKVALCSPSRLFATNEFYTLFSLQYDHHGGSVLCYLEGSPRRAGLVPIKHLSLDGLAAIVQWLKDNHFINICYPAPIPVSDKFWNFIEQTLPDYYERYDVLRQSELQLFIDGKESSNIGLTREEAIRERDYILYRIYAESIDAFTRSSFPKDTLCTPRTPKQLHKQIWEEQSKGYKYLLVYPNQKELLTRLNNDLYTISNPDGTYLCDLLKLEFNELVDKLIILDRNLCDDDIDYMSDWVLADDAYKQEVISLRAAIMLTESGWVTP